MLGKATAVSGGVCLCWVRLPLYLVVFFVLGKATAVSGSVCLC